MKTKKKLITIVMLIMLTVVAFPLKVEANGGSTFKFPTWGTMQQDAKNFLSKGGKSKINTSQMSQVFGPMAQILMGFGIFVLVGVTMVMGIKYMLASPEQAAKLKEQLIGLVVSAVVIFGALGIWKLLYEVFNSTL